MRQTQWSCIERLCCPLLSGDGTDGVVILHSRLIVVVVVVVFVVVIVVVVIFFLFIFFIDVTPCLVREP